MEWHTSAEAQFIGEDNALTILDACEMARMLGDWNGKGYVRHKLLDGRAAWVRIAQRGGLYVAAIAPWDSLFQVDVVDDDTMMEAVKPEGWRTKFLDGFRTFPVLTKEEREARALAKAAKQEEQEARALMKEARAAVKEQTAATKARPVYEPAMAGDVIAIEKRTGETLLCRIAHLDGAGKPKVVRLGLPERVVSVEGLEELYPRHKLRSLAKWPRGAEAMWRKGSMQAKTYWSLTCKLGAAENAAKRREDVS